MAGKRAERDEQEPNLELPELRLPGFRRARRKDRADRGENPPARREEAPGSTGSNSRLNGSAPPRRRAATRRREKPRLSGYLAAALAGVVSGGVAGGLTWAAALGCEAVRGTSSCGGGPGLLILVAIVAVAVLMGTGLLRAFRVPEAAGTSFLGVGVVCVVVLVGLVDVVFSRWMLLALPLLGAAAYSLAHWVTTRFVDVSDEGPQHDVR
jgi:hypothetical protein